MATFAEVRGWIERTYGVRNREIGVERLLESLEASLSRLTKGVRKGTLELSVAREEVARVVSRIIALSVLLNVDLSARLIRKYPGYCTYCNYESCRCGQLGRRELPPHVSVPDQQSPISAFQALLFIIYGFRNAQAGAKDQLLHLFEEIAEVRRAILRESHDKVEEELTDVLAQALGFASLLSIDVESVLRERYELACPECHLEVCGCPLNS